MILYIQQLVNEMLTRWMEPPSSHSNGAGLFRYHTFVANEVDTSCASDQGFANYLAHVVYNHTGSASEYAPFQVNKNGNEINAVYTVGLLHPGVHFIWNESTGFIERISGRMPAVVHQLNRFPAEQQLADTHYDVH